MYKVVFLKKPKKFLDSLSCDERDKVLFKIQALAQNPYAKNNNVKKLDGRAEYRLRVGNIRVIYGIYNGIMTIEVVDIGFRGNIYRG